MSTTSSLRDHALFATTDTLRSRLGGAGLLLAALLLVAGPAAAQVPEPDSFFTRAAAGLIGVSASSSSFGDVDNDGNLDLVITGKDTSGSPTATLYLGDGDGGFAKQDAGLTGVWYGSSSLRDVNNDGNLDLVITGRDTVDAPTSTLYLGDGSGGFTKQDAGLTGVVGGLLHARGREQ